jgi:excisionase family DNA binding protein
MYSTFDVLLKGSETPLFDNQISCEWFGIAKAAAYLDMTPNALRIMVHRGKVKAYKLGRRLRFKLTDLRSALERKRS